MNRTLDRAKKHIESKIDAVLVINVNTAQVPSQN